MTDTGANASVSVMDKPNGDSPHETVQRQDPIFSDETRRVLEIIFYSTLGGLIGVVGSAVNFVNIIVFVKQGFRDSVSISLCALAVSDLGFLMPMIWISIGSNPLFQYSNTGLDTAEISYITGGVFISCFARTTNVITAFITFERCVCVALPLKAKTIITPKRTLISIMAMCVIIFAANLPIFTYVYLASSYHAKRNSTLISFMYTDKTFQKAAHSFSVSVQISSFIIVIICTVILVLKLRSKSKWRHQAISSSIAPDSLSTRDQKAMKMVIFISCVFIACYFPSAINMILIVGLSPEYGIAGLYENSYLVSWAIIDFIDGINSSVTILIYYNMSSKFRATFQTFFDLARITLLKK